MAIDKHFKMILSARKAFEASGLVKKQGDLSSLADEVLNPVILQKGGRGTIRVNNVKK